MNKTASVTTERPRLYWNGSGLFQKTYSRLFALCVPDEGEASTPHGELLRVASKVYYDIYNNGGWNLRAEHVDVLAAWYSMLKRFGDSVQIKGALRAMRRQAGLDRSDIWDREGMLGDKLETLMNAVVLTVKQWHPE